MIVEFIGSSGAGKTTLARMVRDRAGPAHLALDLVIDPSVRRRIRNPQAINLVADAKALPSFLRAWGRNRAFVDYALDRLKRYAPSRFAQLNYAVNVVRRVGMHELTKRRGGATVLADEGTVLIAYQLFVYSDAPFGPVDLERFAALVPMPDGIVYVRAPVDVLVNRAMSRPDRRRELASDDRAEVRRWISRAQDVFEALAEVPAIRDRLLIVEDGGSSPGEIDRIVAFIDEKASPGGRPVEASSVPARTPTG